MKITVTLFLVAILLMCSSLAYAQQDSTIYKVKLEKFKAKEHNGKIITLVGAGAVVVGGIAAIIGNKTVTKPLGDNGTITGARSEVLLYGGLGLAGAGLIAIIPGSINWSVGKKKAREYQIRLEDIRMGFYFHPDHVGVKLAFKF
jgi:hypothetical protein